MPDYFELYELLPPAIYNKYYAEYKKLWGMFDNRVLVTLHNLRHRYGKAIVNDWYWKGKWTLKGWRPWDTLTGKQFSQHKWGRAMDVSFTDCSAEYIRGEILADPFHPDFRFITCIEMEVTWLHFDCRNHNKEEDGILLVYP